MPYLLPCPCGKSIAIDKGQAGTFVQCDQCLQRVEVPTISGINRLPFVEQGASSRQGVTASKQWTPFRGFLAATCFVLALVGLGRSIPYAYFRYQNPMQFDVEDMILDVAAFDAELTPADSWDDWRFLQEAGLGKKSPPAGFRLKRDLEMRDPWMLGSGIIGTVGLIGLIVITLLSRSKMTKP